MGADRLPQDLVGEAWRRFAAGDLDGAIAEAQRAVEAEPPPPMASAALGFFLIQADRVDEAGAVLLPARDRDPGHAPLHWYVGYLLQRRGDKHGAAESLLRACELDATLDEAGYALAWVLHDLGRHDEALRWSVAALERGQTPPRLMQAGWLQQHAGLYARAVRAYREAIRGFDAAAPEQPRLNLHLSQCLVRLGQEAEADTLLRRAAARWPRDAELMIGFAWRQRERGDRHGARRLARELAREHPRNASAWHLLGVLHQDVGDLESADASFAQAQELDLSLTDALLRRAHIHRESKRFEGAKWLLGLILNQTPHDEAAQDFLAQVLLDLDENDAARRLLHKNLRARPRSADLRRLLAVTQLRLGRQKMARRILRRVLADHPGNIEAMRMQGWLALEEGDTACALETVRELVRLAPADGATNIQAAFVMLHAGQLAEAERWAERAVSHAPHLSDAWRALSHVRLRQGRVDEAERAVQVALRLAPSQPDALRQLGWVMMTAARYGQAQLAFLRVIDANPGDVTARLELAEAQCRAGQFEAGLEGVNALLRERADWHAALLLRARLMTEGGFDGAAEACAEALRNDRDSGDAVKGTLRLAGLGSTAARRLLPLIAHGPLHSGCREAIGQAVHMRSHAYLSELTRMVRDDFDEDPWTMMAALYAASMSAASTPAGLGRQARDWFRALKIRCGLARLPDPGKAASFDAKPRIAYVASQLHHSLLRRVLAAHSPDRAQVFLYTNHPYPGLPSHVHLHPLATGTLAESCAANRIDVVIDAGGLHPFEGQFAVLEAYARRLAPVQVGWLGCWGGAGGLFDALLTDEVAVPERHESRYDEEVFRLEGGQWCWDPPAAAPEVSPSPVTRHGGVTYGVTARSLRLGAACLDAFARVVAATPMSSIRFIGEVAGDWPLRRDIVSRMAAQGVIEGRVLFEPFLAPGKFLEWFDRVDLVLDSFPGNGGLSLMEPLWMGVPVVTLAGEWAGARQGAAVLAALGLSDWVQETEEGFCAAAVALAKDTAALVAHRAGLRARVVASPLVDGRRVASQIESLCARLKLRSEGLPATADPKGRFKARAKVALDGWLAQSRTVELPTVHQAEKPGLSVIVVLFNQAGLTLRTLQALADQQGASFETIIVDNASSDRTTELLSHVRGAHIIRNESNLGFLLAARQGADAARGRHLAFLNSDAILQQGALAATLRAMQADPTIGALGGRVVLTDGGLQEAGNMVFHDGSTAGIGRGEDAFGHAARAARATDYVSGVFLVTPAAVWQKLGGFDTAFAPAYFEDTDYCVRVWQAGLRVVYEPSVLLEHLEWGSAAGDSASSLIERHRQVFLVRHREWLRAQSRPHALPLDGDRWRSPADRPRLPRILFIDNEVPHMFKGGGLPRARLILQSLHGWPVTLFPLWTLHDDWRAVHASIPSSIEVALGHGLQGLEAFLDRRRGVYDLLLVSRPPNLDALRPLRARRPELFAGMRLVYDAEALFALREIAMAVVQGRPLGSATAKARIAAELALADGASSVLVVSDRDARHFEAAGHSIRILSHGITTRRDAPGVADRKGLLFVGALHPGSPNEDGLLWFLNEVMPLLRRRGQATPVLSVVGVCLSERVAAMAGTDVRILGAQDNLQPHYDAARVFVAPARFAGGVPMKVIEAAASGIPAAASVVLVRQLGWRDGREIASARDARTFASAIAKLLDDDAAWGRQQLAALEHCALRYDVQAFGEALRMALLDQAGGGA
ncbi:MAG: tetratricopeptide repeat protein [Ramlibacter sp.]